MSDSDIIIENEKNKLINMNQYNIQVLNKLKEFIELLDKIENALNKQAKIQLDEIIELKKIIEENNNIYKIICNNIL
jgi:hypothetical protein